MEGGLQAREEPITVQETPSVAVVVAQGQGVPELADQAARGLRALELKDRPGRDLGPPLPPEVLSRPQVPLVPREQASP